MTNLNGDNFCVDRLSVRFYYPDAVTAKLSRGCAEKSCPNMLLCLAGAVRPARCPECGKVYVMDVLTLADFPVFDDCEGYDFDLPEVEMVCHDCMEPQVVKICRVINNMVGPNLMDAK